MAHGDAVVHRDGVEFLGHGAGGLDLARDELTHVLQVHMAGDELGEGIGDRDDRLGEIAVLHAGGAPQGAGAGHVAAAGGGPGTIVRHGGHSHVDREPIIVPLPASLKRWANRPRHPCRQATDGDQAEHDGCAGWEIKQR